jgi:lysozyme
MTYRNLAEAMIRRHEGCRTTAYLCPSGVLTIGWGRNIQDKGLHPSEIELLLSNDLDDAEADAKRWLGAAWDELDDPRKAVVVDMAFNLGASRLAGFKLLRLALIDGDWKRAAAEMRDSRWAGQVGARATELAAIMETGVTP